MKGILGIWIGRARRKLQAERLARGAAVLVGAFFLDLFSQATSWSSTISRIPCCSGRGWREPWACWPCLPFTFSDPS